MSNIVLFFICLLIVQLEIMQQLIRVEGWGSAEAGTWDARIYEYTMAMLCRSSEFVQKSDSFIKYERILIKHLLSEQFWSSLLAYDILMFCYAYINFIYLPNNDNKYINSL